MKPLPLVYIAGPFRGPTPYAVRKNVEAARDLGLRVAQLGGYPIIPHTMTCDFDKQLTDEFWLDGTMEMLRRCDAIMLGERWMHSTGARAERDEAFARQLPVFYQADDNWWDPFARWVTAWQDNADLRARKTLWWLDGDQYRIVYPQEPRSVAAVGVHDSVLAEVPVAADPPDPPAAASPHSTAPAAAAAASPPPPGPETPAT